MDQRERNTDHEEVLNAALDGRLAVTWTCLPAEVISYNPAKLTCVCQPLVKVSLRASNGSFQWVDLPVLVDVVVGFPMGGGFFVTFPLEEGDEVLVHFADRCIDAWWQNSGSQIPSEIRFHDLSDGFAFPGIKSSPNVPEGLSATDFQIVGPSGFILDVTPGGKLTITAPMGVVINGNLQVNGSVEATEEGTFHTSTTGIPVSSHVHPGVTSGGSDTGAPIP
jgi:hypothetical protein